MAWSAAALLAAAMVAAQEVRLSTTDRTAVVRTACGAADANGTARVLATRSTGASTLDVRVRCPVDRGPAVPVATQARCNNARATWQCDADAPALLVTLSNSTTVAVQPDGLAHADAAQLVREASKLTIRPFYRPVVAVLKGDCTIGRSGVATRKGMESFEIKCGPTVVALTRDCWDRQCRYFIPFAQNY